MNYFRLIWRRLFCRLTKQDLYKANDQAADVMRVLKLSAYEDPKADEEAIRRVLDATRLSWMNASEQYLYDGRLPLDRVIERSEIRQKRGIQPGWEL